MATPQASGSDHPEGRAHRFWSFYVRFVQRFAVVIVALWIGGTVAALFLIPPLSTNGSRTLFAGAVSSAAPALRTEEEAIRRFGYPALAQNVVVQYHRGGLSPAAQEATVATAVKLDTHGLPGLAGIKAAVPVVNDLKLFPGSRQADTAALTYLAFSPGAPVKTTQKLADEYAHRYLGGSGDGLVGVTGAYQAQAAQGNRISGSLDLVEYASIGILLIVVGLTFRSVVAPVMTLFTAVMAYELSERILSWATSGIGIHVPSEMDPIVVVLLLGIITDYSVFYLSAFRRRLKHSESTRTAVREAAVEVLPLVLAASVTVAAGVSLITAAKLPLFAELGPGLAMSVGVAVAAVTTFTPAALSILGPSSLWPSAGREDSDPVRRRRLQQALARPAFGSAVSLVCLAGLIYLAANVTGVRLGVNLLSDLPASNPVARATRAAYHGFAPGVVEPVDMLVQSNTSRASTRQFDEVQARIAHLPGVSGVIGPADIPSLLGVRNVFVTPGHHAARYLVILSKPPLEWTGIHDLERMERAMPAQVASSGLHGFSAAYSGDTGIADDIILPARHDLLYVGLFVAGVDFVMAVILLRALIGPLVLTMASMLVVASTIGLTYLVFPGAAGGYGFTFYVPFACEVLLLSFGADYNLFLSGEIWETSERRPFRTAVPQGATRAAQAINTAGITLALSFSTLALVPLSSFRQLAFCMGVGLLIDTFVVRFLVLPAVLARLGPWARRPDLRLRSNRH